MLLHSFKSKIFCGNKNFYYLLLCSLFTYHDFSVSQVPSVGSQCLCFRINNALLYDFDDVFTDKSFTPFRHSVGFCQQSFRVELSVCNFSGDRIFCENMRAGNPCIMYEQRTLNVM